MIDDAEHLSATMDKIDRHVHELNELINNVGHPLSQAVCMRQMKLGIDLMHDEFFAWVKQQKDQNASDLLRARADELVNGVYRFNIVSVSMPQPKEEER